MGFLGDGDGRHAGTRGNEPCTGAQINGEGKAGRDTRSL